MSKMKEQFIELEDNIDQALHSTEAALDSIRAAVKIHKTKTADKINQLLSLAFDLLDDEQQIISDEGVVSICNGCKKEISQRTISRNMNCPSCVKKWVQS